MTILISIQGNIGSGKSSLLKKIENYKFKFAKKICFLQEPVDEWEALRDENNLTLLQLYYKDQQSYSFAFQIMAFMTRLKQLKEALSQNYDIIFTERSLSADQWVEEFKLNMPDEYIIYLKTDPLIAHERIIERNRLGENIDIDYIKKCHNYHESWLNNEKNICILDGNLNNTDPNNFIKWITDINEFINRIILENLV
jgi:deoxyadenosine/deoxycytidine kinase